MQRSSEVCDVACISQVVAFRSIPLELALTLSALISSPTIKMVRVETFCQCCRGGVSVSIDREACMCQKPCCAKEVAHYKFCFVEFSRGLYFPSCCFRSIPLELILILSVLISSPTTKMVRAQTFCQCCRGGVSVSVTGRRACVGNRAVRRRLRICCVAGGHENQRM